MRIVFLFLSWFVFFSGACSTSQKDYHPNFGLIGVDTLIVNPDNILSNLGGGFDTLQDAYNPHTHLGGYYREIWNVYEKKLKSGEYQYDWGHLEKKLVWCAERHTRVTMRIAQFSGYPYDNEIVRLPDDYLDNKSVYDAFMKKEILRHMHFYVGFEVHKVICRQKS